MPQNIWAWPVVDGLGLPRRLLAPLSASGSVAGSLGRVRGPGAGSTCRPACRLWCGGHSRGTGGDRPVRDGGRPVDGWVGGPGGRPPPVPSPDPGLRYHVFASALTSQWYALAAVQAAGVALSWALAALDATWEEAYELFEVAPVGANGVLFIPHLAGAAPRR